MPTHFWQTKKAFSARQPIPNQPQTPVSPFLVKQFRNFFCYGLKNNNLKLPNKQNDFLLPCLFFIKLQKYNLVNGLNTVDGWRLTVLIIILYIILYLILYFMKRKGDSVHKEYRSEPPCVHFCLQNTLPVAIMSFLQDISKSKPTECSILLIIVITVSSYFRIQIM